MTPRTALALAVLVLALPSGAAADGDTRAKAKPSAARPKLDPAAVLAAIESRLLALAGSEATDDGWKTLAAALQAARGRAIDAAGVEALARSLAEALATASLDAESAERLAQDLYAGLSAPALDGREALMLIEDVSAILRGAGALASPVDDVIRALGSLGATPSDARPVRPPQSLNRLTRS